MRKSKKYIYFLIFFNLFIFSYKFNLQAYQLSENEVKELETLDNELCLAKGHNLSDEFSIKLYWSCRLDLIDDRINNSYDLKGKNKFYITELRRIKKVIINVLTKIESDFLDKLEYYIGKDERKIELRGKDKYYYNLLTFLNYDYTLLNVNSKREIKNIIKTRKKLEYDKKQDTIKENLEKYPECIVYNIKTPEFTKCIDFKKQIEECKNKVLAILNDRNMKNKFNCKQQAIEKYPDYMALYNSEYLELKNMKLDEFNIDRKKQKEREKRMAELNKLMSGPRLSNIQLIDLRKFEEKKCLMDKELENNLFKLTISGECEKILKNNKPDILDRIDQNKININTNENTNLNKNTT